jgi:PPM family protein phosphatase
MPVNPTGREPVVTLKNEVRNSDAKALDVASGEKNSSSDTDPFVEIPSVDELAPKYFGTEPPCIRVEFAAATNPGLVRRNNEDHYAIVRRYRSREVLLTNMPPDAYPPREDEVFALAVADGVGGAACGEIASELALRAAWELTGDAFKWGFSLNEAEAASMIEGINVFMQLIHRRIKRVGDKSHEGMGTTLTGALSAGLNALIAHVGDSRAYLYREGAMRRLTNDQTLAELMVSLKMIRTIDDAAKQFRHTLVSCLGGNYENVKVETTHVKLQDADQLLLCTDGLTDMVDESQIAEILGRTQTPQSACDELIAAALNGGGRDNVTVVLARYKQCAP